MDIAATLSQEGRYWNREEGATEEQIQLLNSISSVALPRELIQLLSFSNGGEGDLALPPLLFMLDPVSEIVGGLQDEYLQDRFAGFIFFGGNGGLERLALDIRSGSPPWPVVMIDPIAGPASAEEIAVDFASFIDAIGHEFVDPEEDI